MPDNWNKIQLQIESKTMYAMKKKKKMTLNNEVKWDGGRRRGCTFQMCRTISVLTAENVRVKP